MLVLLAIIKILCKSLFLSLKVYSIVTLVSETKKISNVFERAICQSYLSKIQKKRERSNLNQNKIKPELLMLPVVQEI